MVLDVRGMARFGAMAVLVASSVAIIFGYRFVVFLITLHSTSI